MIFVDNVKTVETIRALCKKKKTSLTRLEEKLGFSNGYIGKMAKRPSSPPYDKLVAIANELGATVSDLTGDSENEKKPTAQGDGLTEKQKYAIELIKSTSDDDLDKLIEMFKIWAGGK